MLIQHGRIDIFFNVAQSFVDSFIKVDDFNLDNDLFKVFGN